MKLGKALVAIFVILLQGCASNWGEPSSTLTGHPQFKNEKLAKWQNEILDRHAAFASYIESRDSLPDGCRPPQSQLWDIASQSPFTEEEFEKENRVIEKKAVITSGRCVEGESVAAPYIAESIFRYTSTKQNRMRPETVRGKQIVTSYEGQIRRLSLSKERTRYQHSVSQKGIRLAIALPLEEESRGLEGIDAVDTIVSRRTDPRTIHIVRYVGSSLAYEWWTRDGKLHGMFVMHPHKVVAGPGGTTPEARYCYQNGEKAALGECGATAATGNSVSGAAAILGGLAAVALSNDAGFSEDSAIDLGVSVARDIERGELTRDTYESVQNAKPESTERQAAISATRSSNGSAPSDSSSGKLSENSAEYLRYTSADGVQRELPVNKSARANFAGFYANEHRDPAVADYRYQLNPDGSAILEHRACESCTHKLSGDTMSRSWTEEYQAIEWAPMLNDQGKPLTRQVKDMNGEMHRARVLVVLLQGGRTMSLSHYNVGGREALAGPYGVPRLKTN